MLFASTGLPLIQNPEQCEELNNIISETDTEIKNNQEEFVQQFHILPSIEEQTKIAQKFADFVGIDVHYTDILLSKDKYIAFMIKAVETFENAARQLEIHSELTDSHINENDTLSNSIRKTQQENFLDSDQCTVKLPLLQKAKINTENLKTVTSNLYEEHQKIYGQIRLKIQNAFLAIYNKQVQQSETAMNAAIRAINDQEGIQVNFQTIVSSQIDTIKQSMKENEMTRVANQLRKTEAEVLLNENETDSLGSIVTNLINFKEGSTMEITEKTDGSQTTKNRSVFVEGSLST